MKNEKLMQRFLGEYFFMCAFLPSSNVEKKIFDALCKAYYIADVADPDALWEKVNNKKISVVKSVDVYSRISRQIEYDEITGGDIGFTDEERDLLRNKGAALKAASEELPLLKQLYLHESVIYKELYNLYLAGSTNALRVLGFMNLHGFGIEKNERFGQALLKKAAMWIDAEAALMLFQSTPKYNALINAVMHVTPVESGLEIPILKVRSSIPDADKCENSIAVAKVIYDYFKSASHANERETIRNHYDILISRIAYSPVLSIGDKRRILLSADRNLVSSVTDLPLGEDGTVLNVDLKKNFAPISRKDDIAKIRRNLATVNLRTTAHYKPLLLVCDDSVILDIYKNNIFDILGGNEIRQFSANDFGAEDFASTKDNVFISALINTKELDTIFFVDDCSEIGECEAVEFAKWLKSTFRASFRLSNPMVTLDLSKCLFVLFSKEMPSAEICANCEVLTISETSDSEKTAVLDYLIKKYEQLFNIEVSKIDADAKTLLETFSADKINSVLAEIFRTTLAENKKAVTIKKTKVEAEAKALSTAVTMGFIV